VIVAYSYSEDRLIFLNPSCIWGGRGRRGVRSKFMEVGVINNRVRDRKRRKE
jgi:hypothetical protein